jgi:hypothetical protein
MKFLKIALIALVLLITNLVITQPSLADRISEKSPEYTEIVETLDNLLKTQANPQQSDYTAEELQQKIADLKVQKYVLETSEDWGTCRNETGKLLAIYAHKPKKAAQNTIFYLEDGEVTDDDWDCDGILLPNDVKVSGLDLTPGEPVALKIVDGTALTARTNPETGEIELNVPPALITVLKEGDLDWSIPNLAQADIDAQAPNAPTD